MWNPFSKWVLCLFLMTCAFGLWILLRFSPRCEEGRRIAIGEALLLGGCDDPRRLVCAHRNYQPINGLCRRVW